MIEWILCDRHGNDNLIPIGIFASEASAKAAAVDGEYAAIPVDVGTLYGNIVSIDMTGISLFQKSGENTRLKNLEAKADQILADAETINERLDQARTIILNLRDRMDAVEARLDALEESS